MVFLHCGHSIGSTLKHDSIKAREKHSFNKAIRLLGGLPENKVSADDYEIILNEIYQNKEPVLSTLAPADRSNLRKVIRIYDWLKWGKK